MSQLTHSLESIMTFFFSSQKEPLIVCQEVLEAVSLPRG